MEAQKIGLVLRDSAAAVSCRTSYNGTTAANKLRQCTSTKSSCFTSERFILTLVSDNTMKRNCKEIKCLFFLLLCCDQVSLKRKSLTRSRLKSHKIPHQNQLFSHEIEHLLDNNKLHFLYSNTTHF